MKKTGLIDSNEEQIIEGDQLEVDEYFIKDNPYLKHFGVSKVIFDVLPNPDVFGTCIRITYYKKSFFGGFKRALNYKDDMKYKILLKMKNPNGELVTKKDYKKEILSKGFKLSDFKEDYVSNIVDLYSFITNFTQTPKKIVFKSLSGEKRDLVLQSDATDLSVVLDNKEKFSITSSLLIELSKESVDFIKEMSKKSLSSYDLEGDFTKLIARPLLITDSEYKLTFTPCDDEEKESYFKKNKHEVNPKKMAIDDIYISFTSSVDVLNKLLSLGSKIKEI